ncbi:MAG: EamA family transporter [Pseudomonadota bacterium]
MPLSHIAVIALVNLVWGTNIVLSKMALDEFPPLLFAAMRFLLLALLLAPVLKPVKGEMRTIVLAGLSMGALHFTFIYIGLMRAEDIAGIAVATQLFVPFATLLSVIFLGERIRWRRTLGIALAFGGVMWMSFDPAVLRDLDALLLVSTGALMAAAGTIFMKRIREAGVFQLQAWIAVVSFPLLVIASLAVETDHFAAIEAASQQAWLILVFTVLGASLLGHGGMYWLLQRHDVSVISPTTILSVLVAIALGIIVFDETLSRDVIIGASIALSGILIVALRQPRRGPTPPGSVPPVIPNARSK